MEGSIVPLGVTLSIAQSALPQQLENHFARRTPLLKRSELICDGGPCFPEILMTPPTLCLHYADDLFSSWKAGRQCGP